MASDNPDDPSPPPDDDAPPPNEVDAPPPDDFDAPPPDDFDAPPPGDLAADGMGLRPDAFIAPPPGIDAAPRREDGDSTRFGPYQRNNGQRNNGHRDNGHRNNGHRNNGLRNKPADFRAPSDLDAERAILASGLIHPDLFALAVGICEPQHFFDQGHAAIYKAMRTLALANTTIDAITVNSELQRTATAERTGGLPYLFELASHAGSGLSIEHHAHRVAKLGHARRILGGLHRSQAFGYQQGGDPDAFIEHVQNEVVKALEEVTGGGEAAHIQDVVGTVYDAILQKRDNPKDVVGIKTGFRDIDHKLMGFHSSDLLILAARPAMGKTALALNFALNVATQNKAVMIFSLEMGREQLVERFLAHFAQINLKQIRSGAINVEEEIRLREAAGRLSELRLHIDDTPSLSAIDVRARSKRVAMSEGKLDLVVVDYMQLMRGTGGSRQSREQEISEISRSLKGLAKELNCTVLALSQLNRAVESRPDKRPRMADLRESGSIEQDADIICFIFRKVVYDENADPNIAELIVAKHRAGEIGNITLWFQGQFTRFSTYDAIGDEYTGGL